MPVLCFPYVNLGLGGVPLALTTSAGAGSLIIGVLLPVLGVTLWFHREVRVFAGVAAILLALVSFPVANLGGLLLGLFSGLVGGSLACAWEPPDRRCSCQGPRCLVGYRGHEGEVRAEDRDELRDELRGDDPGAEGPAEGAGEEGRGGARRGTSGRAGHTGHTGHTGHAGHAGHAGHPAGGAR
ncbi:hypothetical protein J4032_28400 [Streptomyces formicae]|uniref:Integral membrane protein n=1 Tax=Streptomyces formicae TaxID=1616117 RepID=A0ABY3WQE6_9ACTN|nr:hypothetical protein J4032_28400 [Streptomyces formicae]